jgi:hypothetical protein
VNYRRAFGIFVLALSLAGCGDNIKPPARGAVQSSVSGGMVATSQHYRIVSTVTSGDLNAASSNHSVRGGVDLGGAQ